MAYTNSEIGNIGELPETLTGQHIMLGRNLIQTLTVEDFTGLPSHDNAHVKSCLNKFDNIHPTGNVVSKSDGSTQVHLMKITGLGKEFGVAKVTTNEAGMCLEGMFWGERAVIATRDFIVNEPSS